MTETINEKNPTLIISLIVLFFGWGITMAQRQLADIIKAAVRLEFFGATEGFYVELFLIMDVCFWVGYIITALLVGFFSDKVGRKKLIYISLFLFTVSSIMTGFTPTWNLPYLIVSRAFSGASVGPFFPLSVALLGELYGVKNHAKSLGLFLSGSTVGAVFGWLIAGLSVDLLGNWRYSFLLLAFPILVISIISLIALRESPFYVKKEKPISINSEIPTDQKFSLLKFFSNSFLIIAMSFAALDLFSLWVYDDWIATYLIDVYAFTETPAALYRMVGGIGGAIGVILFGYVADSVGRKKMLIVSISGTTISLLLFLVLGPFVPTPILYIFSFFSGFFAISEFASIYSLVLENCPEMRYGVAMGFVVFFGNGFALLGTFTAAFLADTFIGPNAFLIIPMIAILIRLPLSFLAKDPAFVTVQGKKEPIKVEN